jgi:hypothetical protein
MGEYDFTGLSTRSFEKMVQALALKTLGSDLVIFGDGPDGGREAAFDAVERLRRPAGEVPTASRRHEGRWRLGADRARKRARAFAEAERGRRRPDYYIFVTSLERQVRMYGGT